MLIALLTALVCSGVDCGTFCFEGFLPREKAARRKHLKTLEQEGLPSNFAALVMADDAETVKKNISALKTSYDAAVQAGVEGRLKGKSPAAGGGGGLTKEEEMQSEIRKIIEGSR